MISKERRRKTYKIIEKRIRQIQNQEYTIDKALEQPHRLAKRKAFGCNRSRCKICHPEKYRK